MINYGLSGKKAVKKHIDDPNHQKNMKTVMSNEAFQDFLTFIHEFGIIWIFK